MASLHSETLHGLLPACMIPTKPARYVGGRRARKPGAGRKPITPPSQEEAAKFCAKEDAVHLSEATYRQAVVDGLEFYRQAAIAKSRRITALNRKIARADPEGTIAARRWRRAERKKLKATP